MAFQSIRQLDLFAIAPTLFTAGGAAVDGEAMAAAAGELVARGICDFLLTGSYGEFQNLADDERLEVLRAMRSVDGVRTLMCCAALASTDATERLGARLAHEGADLVMIGPPLAAEVSQAEVIRHFEELSERLQVGIVVYNNPVFGRDLSPDELRMITALPQVVAVKQGTRSLPGFVDSLGAVRQASGGRVRVLAASDLTASVTLFAGADGLTSTNSWIFPDAIRQIVSLASGGDFAAAAAVAAALEPYFSLVRTLGQPRTVKAAMQLRGFYGTDEVRLPYVVLDASEREMLRRVLEECDAGLPGLGVDPIAEPEEAR